MIFPVMSDDTEGYHADPFDHSGSGSSAGRCHGRYAGLPGTLEPNARQERNSSFQPLENGIILSVKQET